MKSLARAIVSGCAVVIAVQVPEDGDASMWGPGRVVDESGVAVTDVIIMRHDFVNIFWKGSGCGHVAVAHSDARGRFFLKPWVDLAKDGDRRELFGYRRGYALSGISKSDFTVTIVPHSGSNDDRLAYLAGLALRAGCTLDPSAEVVTLLERILEEQSALVENDEQRKKYVQHTQYTLQLERERVSNIGREERR
jgi:hypothetical protein